jgi:25S rRNA (uracil2634-N3)-methyltransferase
MAVAVAAPVVIGLDAEVGSGGDGGDAQLEVPPVEVVRKGAPLVEGIPVAVTAGGDDTEKEVKGEKGVNPVKWLGLYSSVQTSLIVGDGDFSFSLALATAFGSGANLVATSLDTYGLSTAIASTSVAAGKVKFAFAIAYEIQHLKARKVWSD